jgi:LCP family protein required for cell wall assembly
MIDFKKKMEEIEKLEAEEGFYDENFENVPKNKKRRKITFYIIAIVAIVLIFSSKVIMSSQSTSDWLAEKGFFNTLRHLIPSGDKELKGEDDDRINILLLGMGGKGHDGAYLTDTIILASLKPSTKEVSLVSIPRDLYVPIKGNGWRKINNINAIAEAQELSGGEETIKALSDVFQLPIHYYIRVDFQGFINVINEIGGIEVNVENTLDDYAYPILGQEDNPDYYARYEHLHFDVGSQKMNGELTLKYARSRHAYGIEGSDFARARRQQLVLEAVKNRLLSKQTLLNPVTIGRLIGEFNRHLSTNLEVWEMIKLWDSFKNTNRDNISNKVLSDAPDSFLVSSISEAGAYILSPASGNFGEIRNFLQNILNSDENITSEVDLSTEKIELANIISSESPIITVKNGTWVTGLAGETASKLESYNITIFDVSNAPERDQKKSLIFDFTYGSKNETLKALSSITGASQSFSFPDWVKDYQNQEDAVDFVVLLGADANY